VFAPAARNDGNRSHVDQNLSSARCAALVRTALGVSGSWKSPRGA
jgi:hypothetical protein